MGTRHQLAQSPARIYGKKGLSLTLPPQTTVPPPFFASSTAPRNLLTDCLLCRGPYSTLAGETSKSLHIHEHQLSTGTVHQPSPQSSLNVEAQSIHYSVTSVREHQSTAAARSGGETGAALCGRCRAAGNTRENNQGRPVTRAAEQSQLWEELSEGCLQQCSI